LFIGYQIREFVKNEIIAHIYSSGDQASLMEESAEEALKRDETLRIYNATKEALRIIADVSRDTITESIPPPIKANDSYSSLSAPAYNT
jgi:dynamin GTPase